MEQQHGASKEIDMFLEDVVEQIQYKPVRNEIKEELTAHIEDRKVEYVEQGMEESKAWNKAIEDMGDAVEIGVHLNEVRKVQKNQPAVILVMALIVIGILGNIRVAMITNSGISFSDLFYFLFGIIIFSIVYYFGYEKVAKHIRKYFKIIIGILTLYLVFFIAGRQIQSYYLHRLTSISILFAVELLSILAVIGMTYLYRSKKYKPFLLITVLIAAIISITSQLIGDYILAANLILLITVYSTLLYMIVTGMMEGKLRNQVIAWILSLGTVVAVLALSFNGSWKYEFEQCLFPEKVAEDYWGDSYNSILVKNLLGKAEMVGVVNLSQEELMSYYTSEWYFDNVDDFYYEYKLQFADVNSVTLEDILPQHYQNNYRIAYWILKYGWFPSIVLIWIVVAAYGMLIRMVSKIRNKMGKVLALSCILALILQFVFYAFGNFGYQFGWFCNFPFISEGSSSIITNAILVGLACSAYRYDRVVKEEKRKDIYDNSCI